MSLSVIINTKNVAKTLERTLKSVTFADEIVVVDMHSTDTTVEIAKKYTDNVFEFEDKGYVEPARNFAIQKATQDWILIVDADEEVPDKLRKTIEAIIHAKEGTVLPDCFYIPRKNIIFDRWIQKTGWWPDYVMRFFRKGCVEWSDELHAIPITRGEVKELPAQEDLALIHHNYQSVEQFVTRLNRYSSIQAKELIGDHHHKMSPAQLVHTFSDEFLRRLFAQQGIDEGIHGTGLSFLQTFSELTKDLKIWEGRDFPEMAVDSRETIEALRQFQCDLNYWIADWHVQHSRGLSALIWRIRRKLLW
jgi:glycosyltransferase involved in cell wall biosynthesis